MSLPLQHKELTDWYDSWTGEGNSQSSAAKFLNLSSLKDYLEGKRAPRVTLQKKIKKAIESGVPIEKTPKGGTADAKGKASSSPGPKKADDQAKKKKAVVKQLQEWVTDYPDTEWSAIFRVMSLLSEK